MSGVEVTIGAAALGFDGSGRGDELIGVLETIGALETIGPLGTSGALDASGALSLSGPPSGALGTEARSSSPAARTVDSEADDAGALATLCADRALTALRRPRRPQLPSAGAGAGGPELDEADAAASADAESVGCAADSPAEGRSTSTLVAPAASGGSAGAALAVGASGSGTGGVMEERGRVGASSGSTNGGSSPASSASRIARTSRLVRSRPSGAYTADAGASKYVADAGAEIAGDPDDDGDVAEDAEPVGSELADGKSHDADGICCDGSPCAARRRSSSRAARRLIG